MVENFDDVSEEEEEDVKPQVAHENARVNKKDVISVKNTCFKHSILMHFRLNCCIS